MSDHALVLTYHSISDAPGPTSISPDSFAMQMETLARCGYASARTQEFLDWHQGKGDMARKVLITFDDAFADFAEVAVPILERHGFTALMFVPTRKLGGAEDWYTFPPTNRPLMRRDQILALHKQGMEFGAHGRTHCPLPLRIGRRARRRDCGQRRGSGRMARCFPSRIRRPLWGGRQ
jgi:peptidoglycan/xylan/chitin deacetylase (PgdA/CDA1 family)